MIDVAGRNNHLNGNNPDDRAWVVSGTPQNSLLVISGHMPGRGHQTSRGKKGQTFCLVRVWVIYPDCVLESFFAKDAKHVLFDWNRIQIGNLKSTFIRLNAYEK